jgi:cyclin G-associated kinase
MSDFIKSAIGIFSNSSGNHDNDFVGQYVELGDQKLRIRKVIAEGGWFLQKGSTLCTYAMHE